MKNILISNDDGVLGPGILANKQALEDFANVTVVAPQENNSAVGRKVNIMKHMYLKEYELADGSMAYGLSGTPADSVNVGINYVCDEKPDLVVTGINPGMKLLALECQLLHVHCSWMTIASSRMRKAIGTLIQIIALLKRFLLKWLRESWMKGFQKVLISLI